MGVQTGRIGVLHEARLVGVRDDIHVARETGLAQAPTGGLQRQLPGRERQRLLAVLASWPLFLRGRRDPAVDHQRGRRIVEHGVQSQHDGHVRSPGPDA